MQVRRLGFYAAQQSLVPDLFGVTVVFLQFSKGRDRLERSSVVDFVEIMSQNNFWLMSLIITGECPINFEINVNMMEHDSPLLIKIYQVQDVRV